MATDVRAVTEDRPEPTAERGKAARDPFLDNAKFLAIALVVVGHAIEPLRDVPGAKGMYVAIYAFHMPVFILISGYLSRSFSGKPRQMQRLISGIVVPYVVFEVSFEVLRDVFRGEPITIDLLNPSFAMWFLIALLIWRLTAPMWNTLHPVMAVSLSIVISLSSGLPELPDTLDLNRVLGFLPFYVAGLMLPKSYFDLINTRLVKALAVPALLGSLLGAYLFAQDGGRIWLYYNESYAQTGVTAWSGIGHRACALALGFVLLSAFLAVVPRTTTWFTRLGAATMYVYLLHRFPRKGGTSLHLYEYPWLHSLAGTGVVIALALALTLLLSSRPVLTLARPFVEPNLDWLFRLRERGRQAHPRADVADRQG